MNVQIFSPSPPSPQLTFYVAIDKELNVPRTSLVKTNAHFKQKEWNGVKTGKVILFLGVT